MGYASLKNTIVGIINTLLVEKLKAPNRVGVANVGKTAVATIAVYFVITKVYSAFFGPLSQIPGPFQFRFQDFLYAPNIENPPGSSWKKLRDWRFKYGDVVRLGPNRLMISNKNMLRQIALVDDLPKGPRYSRYQKVSSSTMVDIRDKAIHKQRRRIISPAFSTTYLKSLEPYMAATIESLFRRIDCSIEDTRNESEFGQVDILHVLHLLSLDVIGETAFGATFHMLEGNDHFVPRTINNTLKAVAHMVSYPILSDLLLALPMISKMLTSTERLKSFMKNKVIMERLLGGATTRRNDILQILIDSQQANNADDRLTAEIICNETILFLIAGSETTANTMGFLLIDLLKHPEAFATLREEIDTVEFEEGQNLLRHKQLKHLPYLNAVISESMRLNAINVRGTERIADRDLILDGRLYIPRDTILDCVFYHSHIDPAYWPQPMRWIPERWIEGTDIPADKDAFFPFNIGPRNCIGQAYALQEIRLVIANLVKHYDFKAIPKELAGSEDRRWFATLGIPNNSFKVLIKKRTN